MTVRLGIAWITLASLVFGAAFAYVLRPVCAGPQGASAAIAESCCVPDEACCCCPEVDEQEAPAPDEPSDQDRDDGCKCPPRVAGSSSQAAVEQRHEAGPLLVSVTDRATTPVVSTTGRDSSLDLLKPPRA